MKTNGNDYANPTKCDEVKYENATGGLTKREHFAAMAMQGILSNPDYSASATRSRVEPNDYLNQTTIAACKFADALISALNEAKS